MSNLKWKQEKERRKQNAVYTLTQQQINDIKREAMSEAVDVAVNLLFGIPLLTLSGEKYWKKSAKTRLPKFYDDMMDVYKKYTKGSLSLAEIQNEIKAVSGIDISDHDQEDF